MTDPTRPESLTYASTSTERRTGLTAGVAMMFAGLGLILLGGCFLIGVAMVYDRPGPTQVWPLGLQALPWLLYMLAFGCFAGAIWLIAAGVRWLYSVH